MFWTACGYFKITHGKLENNWLQFTSFLISPPANQIYHNFNVSRCSEFQLWRTTGKSVTLVDFIFVSCGYRFDIALHYRFVSKLWRGIIWLREVNREKNSISHCIKFWEKSSAFSTNLKKSLPVCMDFGLRNAQILLYKEENCFPYDNDKSVKPAF